jgi:nucleotide-binding universal stress UspA family protein
MVQHLIVPVDGSDASWRAFEVGLALARRCDATVDVMEVVFDTHEVAEASTRLSEGVANHDTDGVTVSTMVRDDSTSVAHAIAAELEAHPEVTVVMASHGRGRSAALLGSVTEEVLELSYGPIVVVGPHCTVGAFDGPVIATVDGSSASESVLPLAVAWSIEMGVEPWIVEVVDRDVDASADVTPTAYTSRLARRLESESGHTVQFEALHGRSVGDEVADFADSLRASLLVASTHGRTGLARFVVGSAAAAIVRRAPCPVLLVRPPHVRSAG